MTAQAPYESLTSVADVQALATLRFGSAPINQGDKPTVDVWGWFVGPFIVWAVSDGTFSVTHVGSGFSVQKYITEQAKALVLAARLSGMADWSFTDPATVKAWDQELVAQITTLRAWAKNDDVDDPLGLVAVPPMVEPEYEGAFQ